MLNGKLIGNELKSLRDKLNKTAEEVSKDINIHQNTLYKYEKDATNLPLGLFHKLLNYYKIDEFIFFKIIREYNHLKIKLNEQNNKSLTTK